MVGDKVSVTERIVCRPTSVGGLSLCKLQAVRCPLVVVCLASRFEAVRARSVFLFS